MSSYPAEPWALVGQLHSSAFLVPLTDVPVDLPPRCHPVRFGRFGVVGTAWVSYEPGGVLEYSELMATLLVRRGWRIMPTIVRIWVDSEASRDGGRALWGIPKELAKFDFAEVAGHGEFAAHDDDGPIAVGTVRARFDRRSWPLNFSVVQWLQGAAKVSPVRTRAAVRSGPGHVPGRPVRTAQFPRRAPADRVLHTARFPDELRRLNAAERADLWRGPRCGAGEQRVTRVQW